MSESEKVRRWRMVVDWCPACGACADDPPNDEPCEACEVRGDPLENYDGEVVHAAAYDALLAERDALRAAGGALADLWRLWEPPPPAYAEVTRALAAWRAATGDPS